MGKWHKEDKLQNYLDELKERQDHQYSRRMSFYRIKPESYYKPTKAQGVYFSWLGFYLVLLGLTVLFMVLYSGRESDFVPNMIVYIVIIGLGGLYLLAGLRIRKRR